jgi:hypothetical protein
VRFLLLIIDGDRLRNTRLPLRRAPSEMTSTEITVKWTVWFVCIDDMAGREEDSGHKLRN